MNNLMNRQWWAAAGTRCIKTGAQAALGTIGASAAVIGQVNWEVVAGAAALAAVVSLLTSLEGLPEVDSGTTTTPVATADTAPVVDTAATADAATTTAPVVVTESTTAVTSPTSAVTNPTTTSTDAASVPAATTAATADTTDTTTDKEA